MSLSRMCPSLPCFFSKLVTLFVVLCTSTAFGAINVYRVDVDSPCPPGEANGQSWVMAYAHLDDALAVAQAGDEVWVAEGTYLPSTEGEPDPRKACFALKEAVAVYGGFSGAETALMERDPASHPTLLSGDIDGDDVLSSEEGRQNNAYHVVKLLNAASDMTRLEGFTISGGYAVSPLQGSYVYGGGLYLESARLSITRCLLTDNAAQNCGGGIYAKDSALTLTDCTFGKNTSNGFGAGVAVFPDDDQTRTSTLNVERCVFRDNLTNYALSANHAEVQVKESFFIGNEGGGLCATDRVSLHVTNCVFTQNGGMWSGVYIGTRSNAAFLHCTVAYNLTSELSVDAENLLNSTVDITNSILWNETWPVLDFDPANATVTVAYSLIHGGFAGMGNMDASPQFRLTEPPCQLSWDSPAIDAGMNAGVVNDIQNVLRPQNMGFDMGAYEFGEDSDEGGLPDTYEDEYDLNSADPADDAVDSDGDGLDNREEFRRRTSPRDINDPPSQFYLDTSGSDETGDGSQSAPWRTIAHAMSLVPEGLATFPITIHVGAGTFEEKVVLRPYTRIVGAGSADTLLQYYQASDDEHVVVTAAQGSGVSDCTITFPSPVTATAELLRAQDVSVEVSGVVFNGVDSPHAIAVFITGTGSSSSIIRDSVIRRAEYGVFAVDSGVNVTRNTFEDLFEVGIFIRPPDGKQASESATPLLGDEENASQTGFNRFRMSTGVFVKNMTANVAKAEYNDWGEYMAEAIAGRVVNSPGEVDYQPFLGAALLGSVIAVNVVDESTGERIPDTANPVVRLGGSGTSRDVASSLFIFKVDAGSYTCSAAADGYEGASQLVHVDQGGAVAIDLTLTKTVSEGEGQTEGEGEGEGEKENAVLGCHAEHSTGCSAGDWLLMALVAVLLGIFLRTVPYSNSI